MRILKLLAVFLFPCLVLSAQPNYLFTNIANQSSYVYYSLTDFGKFRQYRALQSTVTSFSPEWAFLVNNNFGTCTAPGCAVWRHYSTGGSLLSYNTFISPNTTLPGTGALYNNGSSNINQGAASFLASSTQNNYYTFNITEDGNVNCKMQVLQTSYVPVTITAVSQSPAGSFVNSSISPTITVTTSATPSSGENVFIRYSTDVSFDVSSTIVQVTMSGNTGTATIPAQTAGTLVYYYVFTSSKTSAQLSSDVSSFGQDSYDMATIDLQALTENGSGNTNFSYTSTSNPVVVNSTGGTASANYATLKAAFDAINAGTHTSVITTLIEGNTTETATAALNASGSGSASYTSVSIQPNGGAYTVSGAIAGNGIVHFNGADNVTLNGINSGGTSLTISNTSTSSSTSTCAVRFTNDAANNTVQNCTITGSSTSSSAGVIVLGDGSITGNNNNTISNNTISAAGSNLPVNGIYSNEGVSPGNNNNIVSNNNISDYFSATTSSAGINLNAANDGWTISGNKFFQTGTRTTTTASITHRAIYIISGSGYTISNNTIGYASSSGTGTSTYTGAVSYSVWGIYASTLSITANSIQGNTIAGFSITTTGNSAINNGNFIGINLGGGIHNVGTVSGNVIGGATGTGSISITLSANAALGGIVTNSSSTVNIQNNTIGSFTIGGGSSISETFYGIVTQNTSGTTTTISSNIIGSTSTANSIVLGNSGTTISCNFYGVNNFTGIPVISSNTIQNCSLSGTGTDALWAIYNSSVSSGTASITNNNVINNLHSGTSGTYYGIYNTAAVATLTVTGNIVRNATVTNSGITFCGFLNNGSVTTAITVSSNQFGNASGGLITFSSATPTTCYAIQNGVGASTAALTIQSNDITGITNTSASSATQYYIYNAAATLSQDISNNTFTNLSVNTTGSVYFIWNSVALTASGTKTINNNSINGTFTNASGGFVVFYFDGATSTSGATVTNSNNNFSNITIPSGATLQGWYNTESNSTKTISGNTFSNITITSGSLSYVMRIEGSGSTATVSGNTISNINNSANQLYGIYNATGGTNTYSSNAINNLTGTTVYGIVLVAGINTVNSNTINTLSGSGSSTLAEGIYIQSSTTANIYSNKIYDISHSGSTVTTAALSSGIYVIGGTTVNIYNNIIGDIKAPNANSTISAARGININSSAATSNINVYYNTVYLNASSAGTNFSTSAMYHTASATATTAALDMRNNIFVNKSTAAGTGLSAAYERSSSTLTNYASTSNNNLFYAGTPSGTNLIFYDGTNKDQTLTAFQNRVSSREYASVTEDPNFLSTTGSSSNYLHINTAIATYIESRGKPISGYTDDYDGNTRSTSRPDIGADEFSGTAICNINLTATGGTATGCYLTVKAAFDEINAGTHTGTIALSVINNTSEFATASLNASGSGSASYSSISMQPSGGAFTVSNALTLSDLVTFNGADNVTVNGLNSGGNSLSFSNTSTTANSTIRFQNDATSNTIQNCTITSSGTNSSSSVIFFGDASASGNSNNTITSNTISANSGTTVTYGIFTSNTIGGTTNTNNTISNNNIADYFSATSSSRGIYVNQNSPAWTISGNKFYQTATRTTTTSSTTHSGILIADGYGFTISNNIIGYANSSGTGTSTYTSATTAAYTGIDLTLTAASSSSITNNTIAGISFTTAATTTGGRGIFSAVYMSSGLATITNNIIGVISTGTIGVVSSTASSTGIIVAGINCNVATNSITVSGNTVTAMSATGSNATTGFALYPILVSGTGIFAVSSNTIGDASTANSIASGTSATSTAACSIRGIYGLATGGMSITGNTIQNCSAFGTGSSFFVGINTTTLSGGTLDITNNNILNNKTEGNGSLQGIANNCAVATLNISNNVLRNFTLSNTTSTFIPIQNSAAVTTSITINSNQLGNASGGLITYSVANSGSLTGISNSSGGASVAVTIQSNDIRGITHSVAGTNSHTYISNSTASTMASVNISNNTFTNLSVNTTGNIIFISNTVTTASAMTKTVSSNSISGTFTKTGTGGSIYFYNDIGGTNASGTITNSSNNFSNVTLPSGSTLFGWTNSDGATGTTKNITNNTFSSITVGSSGSGSINNIISATNGTGSISGNTITSLTSNNSIVGIVSSIGSFDIFSNTINNFSAVNNSFVSVTGVSITGGTSQNVYQNTINTFSTTSSSSTVSGISVSGGTTVNIYKNKIYDLSTNTTSSIYGLNLSSTPSTVTAYNNYIGDLRATAATSNDAIRGISAAMSSGTANIYYNTVYLSGTSSGSGFGSSCIYANTGPTVNLRNNVFVNLSTPTGSGLSIAYRRNGSTLSSYASTSNNNLFYAGTPGSTNVIYYDGTSSDRTLAEFQGRLSLSSNGGGTRDIYSVTESPSFLSTTGSNVNFLHINTAIATYIESRGVNISGITDDYDGDIRQGNGGYSGTGTAPDIGADEFAGTAISCGTITVTSTGGTGAPSSCYLTLSAAVSAINGGTIHTGTITCNVPAGFTETAPAGGYQLTASGTSANPVTYIKSGAGANPTITASASLTSGNLNDGIFKLIGADYTTIDGFTMQENSSNTTTTAASNNMTEWGVALLYTTTTNGAQNNTIQNCNISLNKTYSNTFGIYSNVRHSATAPTTTADITSSGGANGSNKVYSNTISNVNMGIAFIGSGTAANMDASNDIGGSSSSTGNTISNFGSLAATSSYVSNSGTNYGVYMNHQTSYNVSYNTLTSSTGVSATTFNGIRTDYTVATPTGTFTNTISNNTITMDGAGSTAFRCIDAGSGVNTMTLTITGNTLLNNNVTGASTNFIGIINSGAINTLNVTSNIIRGTTSSATTGGFTGISNTGNVTTAININSNQIGNSSGNAITFSASTTGTGLGISNTGGTSACALSIQNNNFQGIVHSVSSSASHTYISNSFATLSQNISSNTFTNITANVTGNITFISNSVSLTATGTKTISSNSIVTGYNKSSAGGTITFYSDAGSSVSGATITNSSNNFSNITATGATIIAGWSNADGSSAASKTIQNNTFNNITGGSSSVTVLAVSASGSASISGNTITNISGSSSVTGISIGSGTQTVSSNTINNLSSTGGSVSGITVTAGTTNNISQNTINTLSSSSASSTVSGIAGTGGTTVNIFKNKIYDVSETNATVNTTNGATNGILISGGTTVSVYNNLIGDLKATTASSTTDAIRGINVNSTTTSSTINLYYNTVYINASSSGTNFSTTGVYHTTSGTSTTAALDMRNNIIVNLSTPNGSGNTVAFRRSSTTLTNYASTSNNNLLYAGTASSTRLIFTDGTNSDQTMDTYITRVSTRDLNSVTENPTFLSTTGSSSSFLHINTSTPTVIEAGAATISGYTDDYDGDTRSSTPDIGADEFTYTGISTAAYYFRTKSTGINWNNATYWEYSPDGSTWSNATSYPTSAATKINVLSGHTITIAAAATANALQVDAGGTLNQTNGIGLTIANGSGNDGSGVDFIVNGTYVINGTQPTFNTSATAEIRNGGVVRADANTGGASDDFAFGTNATFKTGAVFQWNNTLAFQTTGQTYFPNSTTSDIPIFRITASLASVVGSNSATIVNGKFEVTSPGTITWSNSGTKTFRDGIGGTGGTLVHDNTCGTFAITGTSAVIDGTVTVNINNTASITTDMQIASGASCTISGSPVISIGTATNTGALLVVDGTLTHNGSTAIDFKTGSGDLTVNGSLGSGTGTFTCSSTATDITVGGSSGGSAGIFKFTTGSANNTASTLTISRTGSGADMTLGSDFGVSNAVSNSSAKLTIGANTLTMNGTITGAGTFTGSSSSNMIIGGTTGGSFGTLLFTPGAQTLNNFTMGRTGASSSVTLGTSNNLTVGNTFDITNAATTVVIGSNTVTMNGTLTGSGSFTGSSSSSITVGGTSGGSLGTIRFASGAQTLNTLTISRTGSSANAVLGSDLSINNILDIINSAASFSIASNTLTLAGTITGSGSLSGTTSSNLSMSGSGQVGTLRFATGGQLLNTLSLNRTGISNDYAALLGSDLTANAFTLTNGILATGNNLLTWTKTGSLSAPNIPFVSNNTSYKNSYICTCDGTGTELSFLEPFDGSKGFRINNVGTDTWFPVGVDFTAPNRMWINNTGTSDNITVAIQKGDIYNTDFPVVERIWYVYENTTGGTTADMQLFFTKQDNTLFGISQDEVENGFDYTATRLAQRNYNDDNYLDISQGADIQNLSSNTLGTEVYANYSIGVSPDVANNTDGINYFSRFMVLNDNAFILPVTITNFRAWQNGDKAMLSWISNTETNIESYVIERSADNRHYTSIGSVKALNSGALSIPYSFTDALPLTGKNYYRIKVIEKDGRSYYTNIQTLNFIRDFVVKVYPNPVQHSRFTLQLNDNNAEQFILKLYSLDGKLVFTNYLNHAGGSAAYNINIPAALAKGIYVLRITGADNSAVFTQNILIE